MRPTLSIAAFILLPTVAAAQLVRPPSWRLRTDTRGASADTVHHVQMPPGWHITTGPGAILYDPANTARGRYAVAMEVHLFPGESAEGYGLLLGGARLEAADAGYVAFLVRRDGSATVERFDGTARSTLVPWTRASAVKPHPGGDDTVLNRLRVSVEPDSVRFEANGLGVLALARGELPLEGIFGFRVGPGVNLHVTNLDVTTRIAPPARPRR